MLLGNAAHFRKTSHTYLLIASAPTTRPFFADPTAIKFVAVVIATTKPVGFIILYVYNFVEQDKENDENGNSHHTEEKNDPHNKE